MCYIILQLNESADINIPDCTNIDVSKLEQLYFRMDLLDTLKTVLANVEDTMNSVAINELPIHQIFHCAWMNDRILDNCRDENSNYTNYRNTLNNLCDRRINRQIRRCNGLQLCSIAA